VDTRYYFYRGRADLAKFNYSRFLNFEIEKYISDWQTNGVFNFFMGQTYQSVLGHASSTDLSTKWNNFVNHNIFSKQLLIFSLPTTLLWLEVKNILITRFGARPWWLNFHLILILSNQIFSQREILILYGRAKPQSTFSFLHRNHGQHTSFLSCTKFRVRSNACTWGQMFNNGLVNFAAAKFLKRAMNVKTEHVLM